MLHINTVLLILLILLILLFISYWLNPYKKNLFNQKKMISKKSTNVHSQCTVHSCGANGIDHVSDPVYNMKEIIKQSILLEEHLVQPKKRCRDCISKHFIHINRLHEEALWLANSNCNKYPFLVETTGFYSEQFDEWLNSYDHEDTLMQIAGKLRDIRKKLASKYYFNNDNTVLIKKNYRELTDNIPTKIIENNPKPPITPSVNINSYGKIY